MQAETRSISGDMTVAMTELMSSSNLRMLEEPAQYERGLYSDATTDDLAVPLADVPGRSDTHAEGGPPKAQRRYGAPDARKISRRIVWATDRGPAPRRGATRR